MSTIEMLELFDLLQDKYNTPYFTTQQKLLFLNRAGYIYLKDLFPDNEGGIVNVERDWNILQNIHPLIFELSPFNMSSSGTILRSDIKTALRTQSGDSNCDVFKILSVEFKRGNNRFPCKVLRHNDKAEFEINYFKRPDFDNPRYLLQNNSLKFRPIDTLSSIYITVVKTPIAISDSPLVNSDFPEDVHNRLVAIALELAGIASRDEALVALTSIKKQP